MPCSQPFSTLAYSQDIMRGSRFTVPGSRFGFAVLSSTLFVLSAVILAAAPRAQEHDPTLSGLDLILDTYVRDGDVYYRALKSDRRRLDAYVASLAAAPAETQPREERISGRHRAAA